MTLVRTVLSYLLANWSAVLSILAIGISVVTLYKTVLKPFTLEVRESGRVELGIDPYTTPDFKFVFSVDLGFSNKGIGPGVVEDVALHVTNPGGQQLVFRSLLEYQSRRLHFTQPPPQPELEIFLGFDLKGLESVSKKIMFSLYNEQEPFIVPGEYTIDVHCRTSRNHDWNRFLSIDLSIKQEEINKVRQTTATQVQGGGYNVNLITQGISTGSRSKSIDALVKKLGLGLPEEASEKQ